MAVATQPPQNMPQMSLYVGDLHPLVTEALLYTKFSEIGNVLSARVCRDLATRNSLGYAYINFEDPKDAERALDILNYESIMGRPIRLMWSQRDPSLRKSGRGNIFIKNLDKNIEQKELYDTFSFFGRILSCKIAMDEHGHSKGYGFVHFEKEECALRAIEKINGMVIQGRVVYVGKFIPSSDRKSTSGRLRFNNIYVKNFPPETTDESLKEMFTEFGEIKSCCVEKDGEGKSKGFGFVCFAEPEQAEAAVKTMHGKEIGGRALYASRAQRKEERQEELKQRLEKQRAERQSKYISGVNLYVKNLDDHVDDEALKNEFSQFGLITSAKVMTDANGRSKGFGFVCFTHPDQAAKAVTEMNAAIIGSKPLYVALAQRKEDRRAKLIAEHQQRLAEIRHPLQTMMQPTHPAAPSYFQPTFPQAQRYYHPSTVIGSQPRWNRAANLAAGAAPMQSQLGAGMPARPPIPSHYLGAPNHMAGMNPGQMAAMGQLRPPANVGRPMIHTGLPAMHGGPHVATSSAILNNGVNQQRQIGSGRPAVPMQQVMPPPSAGMSQRPSMASVVAHAPNMRPVMPPVQRAVLQAGMPGGMVGAGPPGNVRFNQTARNVASQQPASGQQGVSAVAAPLGGDQGPITISALAQLSEEDQKRSLGERLYPMVQEMYPGLAQKLTGMLLGVENAELIHLLESKESLRAKLEEGITVLKESHNLPAEALEETRLTSNGDGASSNEVKPAAAGHQLEKN